MHLQRLWLGDFRSYEHAELTFPEGLTAIVGPNGQGKTNLLEAVFWLATMRSFRGAATEALVRQGVASAVIRAEIDQEGRTNLIEAELTPGGRARVQVNRQRLARARDLVGHLRVTVFAPDDLDLVKGGPAGRRDYLDDAVVAARPSLDRARSDYERVLRQRNALLKQAGGRLTDDVAVTLDVWDTKLVAAGEAMTTGREAMLERLAPRLSEIYGALSPVPAVVGARYDSSWLDGGLTDALLAARRDDVRRGVTTVGPHRDDLDLTVDGLSARTHRSQGEQRSVALALRIAVHQVITETAGSPPVLLLDDVFSELDDRRAAALLANLPVGQTLLTSATELPPGARPEQIVRVDRSVPTVEA